MNKLKDITIIIPAHNCEFTLQDTVDSIIESHDIESLKIELNIVCNGCIDNTLKVAESIRSGLNGNSQINVIISNLKRKRGKVAAINHVLDKCATEIVVNVDDDCVLNPSALKIMLDSFSDPNIQVVGSRDIANTETLAEGSILKGYFIFKSLKSRFTTNKLFGGRFFSFRKSAVIKFPDGITSEDYWLAMSTILERGSSVISIAESEVYYYPPTSWAETIKQITRFRNSVTHILEEYPSFEGIFRHQLQSAEESFEDKRSLLKEELLKFGYTLENIIEIDNFIEMLVKDEEMLTSDSILRPDGTWEYIPSTKRKK